MSNIEKNQLADASYFVCNKGKSVGTENLWTLHRQKKLIFFPFAKVGVCVHGKMSWINGNPIEIVCQVIYTYVVLTNLWKKKTE